MVSTLPTSLSMVKKLPIIGGKVSFSVHAYNNWRDSKNAAAGTQGMYDIKTEILKMRRATGRAIWIGEFGRVKDNMNPRYTPNQLRADSKAAGAEGTLLWGWATN